MNLDRFLIYAFAFLFASKPILDCFWSWKLHVFNAHLNLQGMSSVLMIGMASVLSVLSWLRPSSPSSRAIAALFAAFSAFSVYRMSVFHQQTEWFVKYWAGIAAVPVLHWILLHPVFDQRIRRIFTRIVITSMAIALLGVPLQMLGILDWHYVDTTRLTGSVGRVSGFYFHPLDLWRVVIWGYSFAALWVLSSIGPVKRAWWIGLTVCQFFLLRTTHRIALLLIMGLTLFLAFYFRRWKRAAALIATLLVGWGFWSAIPGARVDLREVFSQRNFISSGFTKQIAGREIIEGPKGLILGGTVGPDFKVTGGRRLFEINFNIGRGRLGTWIDHVNLVINSPASQFVFGIVPQNFHVPAPEPHNQVLDFIECYGVAGTLLIIALLFLSFREMKSPMIWKGIALATWGWFSITAQPFAMPTFIWWGLLFASAPLWWSSASTTPLLDSTSRLSPSESGSNRN